MMTQQSLTGLRKAINQAYLAEEKQLVTELSAALDGYNPVAVAVVKRAFELLGIARVRLRSQSSKSSAKCDGSLSAGIPA